MKGGGGSRESAPRQQTFCSAAMPLAHNRHAELTNRPRNELRDGRTDGRTHGVHVPPCRAPSLHCISLPMEKERICALYIPFTHQLEKRRQQMGAVAHQSVQLSLKKKKKKRRRKWSQHALDTDFGIMCRYPALFSKHNALWRWEFGGAR